MKLFRLIFSCSNKSAHPNLCQPGEYSSAGAIHCESCNKGFMCPYAAMHSPFPCVNGTFANETKSRTCNTCPAGYECLNPRETPRRCKEGFYSLSGVASCFLCPSGHRYTFIFMSEEKEVFCVFFFYQC